MKTKILLLVAAVSVVGIGSVIWLAARSDTQSPANDPEVSQQDKIGPSIELNVTAADIERAQKSGSLQVSIRTDDYDGIARVEYLFDGEFVAYSTTAPFSVKIDLSEAEAGEHTLQAIAHGVNGLTGRSNALVFTLTDDDEIAPANDTSETIINQSINHPTPNKDSGGEGSPGGSPGGGGGSPDTTAWPDDPPALVCDNTGLLSGLSSAPAGAVTVPAGDNSSVDFTLDNTTYWFAAGTHTLGTDQFSQIIPGDDATFVGAPGAILDGQGLNNYAFTQHAVDVTVQYLTIQNFTTPKNEGTVNHDSGVGWTIEYNTIQDNGGAGLFLGSDNVGRYNCLRDNGQYGFQVYSGNPGGPQNVVLDHNEISGNNTDDWETADPGCGCSGGGKLWEATTVDITNNYVHDNLSVGLWADTNDIDFLVEGNYIADNDGQGLFYEASYNMIVRENNFVRNAHVGGPDNPGFPTGAIYLSEAGGDSRVAGRTDKIEIYDNNFEDNWSGVILWENADRFCASPANTSSGTCTLVNPDADLTTCSDPGSGGSVDQAPYYDDCRWKTQNVEVHDNVFSIDPDSITGCSVDTACGFNGVFSNFGTFPTWSPYMGDVIQQAITFDQNNTFSDNEYIGDWYFKAFEQDTEYNFAIWQDPPYSQDAGSIFNGTANYVVANALDDDTSTLEGSIGDWSAWFSSSIARSNAEAHTDNNSLEVTITDPFGWGVELSTPASVTNHDKTLSFWAKLGSGSNLGVTMSAAWLDEDSNSLGTSTIGTISPLTTEWQQVSTQVTPPTQAASVIIRFTHSSGTTGNTIYIDDVVVADDN